MSSRRVLGLTAECAYHHGPPITMPIMRVGAIIALRYWGRQGARRYLQSSAPQWQRKRSAAVEWEVHPPREPTVHLGWSSSSSPPTNPAGTAPETMSMQVRNVMRLVTHSVVACTSTLPGTAESGGLPAPRAMTMSSFTSLALTPTPVVSFNILTPSRTLDAIRASRRFNIHILSGDRKGAKVADRLTRGNLEGIKVFQGLEDECDSQVILPNLEVNYLEVQKGQQGGHEQTEPPLISGPGVLYVFRCKLFDEAHGGLVKVRDHVIVLGEVIEIVDGREEHDSTEQFGLIYADRTYRQLGNCMVRGSVTDKED
ncbi:flavin reductase like domain-containing protein [Diplogelasinospora grovesii]|uniref:Flavin reductase like domain-containing protein n=1 Tax=Diplogelasinospora grovesii TaxID=303347 RepID=A0AAN6S5P2_9PEZI|nr:flavin reductase like domain-containing protein [Diplogelasinospora grovesii]